MNWENELIRYYKRMENLAGEYQTDKRGYSFALLPIRHTAVSAVLEVTIGTDSEFVSVSTVSKEDSFTITGSTEDSASRSSNIAPHFLCDTLEYAAGDVAEYGCKEKNGKNNREKLELKTEAFRKQISDVIAFASEKAPVSLLALYDYLAKKRLIQDIISCQNEEVISTLGIGSDKFRGDAAVRFRVQGAAVEETWKDKELFSLWMTYCEEQDKRDSLITSMISGEKQALRKKTPTGVLSGGDASKIYSSNAQGDSSDYTFQGRFLQAKDIARIGRIDDAMIYSALKYLIKTAGRNFEDFFLITWNSSCKQENFWSMDVDNFLENGDIEHSTSEPAEGSYVTMTVDEFLADSAVPSDYEKSRQEFMERIDKRIEEEKASEGPIPFLAKNKVYVLGLRKNNPGQTKGRLAVVTFDEMNRSAYLENYKKWQTEGGWHHIRPIKGGFESYYGLPSLREMAVLIFGREKDGIIQLKAGKSPNMLVSQFYQEISKCILFGDEIPTRFVDMIQKRALNPLYYKKSYNYERVVSLACSLIAKKKKLGDMKMLNVTSTNRSYLFGRLLAVADRVERRTFTSDDKNRRTNAEKLMCNLPQQPAAVWRDLRNRIEPYFKKLEIPERMYYKNLLDEITDAFQEDAFTNRSLSEEFLLGYSQQMMELKRRRKPAAESTDPVQEDTEN